MHGKSQVMTLILVDLGHEAIFGIPYPLKGAKLPMALCDIFYT
eukprot:COSAG03_NODE_2409_length_2799_cov_11.686680_3_plen_43_part_00